jgi:hypothetical protein
MKITMNTLTYYLKVVFPILPIAYFFQQENTQLGAIMFLIYIFVYRPWIDYRRLQQKGIHISFFELLLPLERLKYFKSLYGW